jgi:NhaA family Na+:H+ antiporter
MNETKHAQPHDPAYTAPWERTFDRIVSPFEEFIHTQTSSGLMLMAATVLALVLANSTLSEAYAHFFHLPLALSFGNWALEKSLHHWINDGLMALFFFLVGLEIKREVLVGELASVRQAALPIVAAAGGMVVPALVYAAINPDGMAARGWAIPMATDIAFAVGALVLLGRRVPQSLMMFLVALAIVDDLGGVLVIALFYTDTIALDALGMAALLLALLAGLNLAGVRRPLPYFLIGALLWLAMLQSGIHATIAGVLVAFTIPAKPKYDPGRFSIHMRELLDRFDHSHRPGVSILRNEEQKSIVQTLENGIHNVETPLQRLEHAFHLPVGMLIVPVFALANAGIPVAFDQLGTVLRDPVTLGVMAGLVCGKFIGIAGASWLAVRIGLAQLPAQATMHHIAGVGLLGGIGFTMSIFIAELGFAGDPEALLMAKTGILFASIIAGTAGYVWLWRTGPVAIATPAAGRTA